MSDLLSVQEAATLLRCSEDTIRRRLRAGTLRYTRTGPGGHYRIQRADLLLPVPEAAPRRPRAVTGEAAGWIRELHPYARA
jgi:excisionase family DNA binding protein